MTFVTHVLIQFGLFYTTKMSAWLNIFVLLHLWAFQLVYIETAPLLRKLMTDLGDEIVSLPSSKEKVKIADFHLRNWTVGLVPSYQFAISDLKPHW